MHGLLKKLLVLNGYLDEAGGGGDPGNGGQPGSGGASTNELASQANEGGADPGSEATGGAEGGGAGDEGGAGGDQAAAPKVDAAAKRYSDLTKQLRESQESDRKSREQLAAALKALDRLTPAVQEKPAAPAQEPQDQEPSAPVFEDPDQYQRDMAEYTRQVAERSAKRALQAADADRKRAEIEASNQATKDAHAKQWNSKRDAALAKYPDYAEVAENPVVPITSAAALAITTMEHGTDVAYYLGQHLEEAQRISALPSIQQVMELAKIEVKVLTPKPPPVSKASAPITPLTGNGSPQQRTDDELSMDEYAARRNGKR